MTVYTISQASSAERLRKIRIWAAVILVLPLVLFLYLRISYSNAFGRSLEVVGAVSFALLVELIRPFVWKRSARKRPAIAGGFCIEVTPDAVELRNAFLNTRIARNEIVRAEEPSWGSGIYLRTSSRYRLILIPRKIEGFEEIKSTLAASGIPIIQTMITPNWEGLLFGILFCGSILCDMFAIYDIFAISRIVLFVNLGVALLIGIYGFIISDAVEGAQMRLKSRLGSLIPLVGVGFALLFQFGWL